jgi:hypothetical protein
MIMSEKQHDTLKKSGRIFSQEELNEFSKGFMELAIKAIDDGDYERARYWCQREADTNSLNHDLFVNWVASLLSYIYDALGEEAAVNVTRKVLGPKACRMELVDLRKQGPEAWVQWCVDMWRQHGTDPGLTVEEDDEKFILTIKCGSGGKMLEMGCYEGQDGYRRLQKRGPQTWGEVGVPIYCGHCSWVHEIIPMELGGQGSQFWVHASPFPQKPGDPCIHHIYKNPEDIPDKYYTRMGLKKKQK